MFGVVVVENVWLVSAVAEERVGAVERPGGALSEDADG